MVKQLNVLYKWQSLSGSQAIVKSGKQYPVANHNQQVAARRVAMLVNRAAQQPFVPATCLSRSLYLQWLLKRHGITSQLRIGIDKTTGVFKAHAWVECAGIPMNDQPDLAKKFSVFPERHPYHAETK